MQLGWRGGGCERLLSGAGLFRLISEGMLEISVLALETAVRDLSRAAPAGAAQRGAVALQVRQRGSPRWVGGRRGGAAAAEAGKHPALSSSKCSSRTGTAAPYSSVASSVLHRARRLDCGTETAAAAAMRVCCSVLLCASGCEAVNASAAWPPSAVSFAFVYGLACEGGID